MTQEQNDQHQQQSQKQDIAPERILLRKSINDYYIPVKDTFMTFRTVQQENEKHNINNSQKGQNVQSSSIQTQQQKEQGKQQEKILQSPEPVKQNSNDNLTVDQLPSVNPVKEITNTSQMKKAAEEMTKYIPLVDFNPKNYYQLPQGTSRGNYSFIKQDTMNYSYRRPSLTQLYKSNTIIHPNRYNYKYHQSQLPLDQFTVVVPKQGKRSSYVPKDTDIFTPEEPKISKKQKEPSMWEKKTTWEKKIHTRKIDPIQRVPVNCVPDQQVLQHKKQTDDTKKQLQSHIEFKNGLLSGTQVSGRGKHILRPIDHKSVFVPYDDKYGVDKFKGQTSNLNKPDLTKSGMRPLSQIKQPIQQVAGVKSGQEFEQIDTQVE